MSKAKRFVVYSHVSECEHAFIQSEAKRAGLSVSDYVRRAINTMLFEESEESPLLTERRNPDHAA
jgi:hypothetical protein